MKSARGKTNHIKNFRNRDGTVIGYFCIFEAKLNPVLDLTIFRDILHYV